MLIAAGRPENARHRLDPALALAEGNGMHFYDAELMRLRARTHADARLADIGAARDLARRQGGAALFELRAALDDFELLREVSRVALADVVNRFPIESGSPELARAVAALEQSFRKG